MTIEIKKDVKVVIMNKGLDKYLEEIGKAKLLTIDEELELVKAVQQKGTDCDEMKKLHEVYNRFVVSIAKQYIDKGLSLEELVELGKVGMGKAAQKYDHARGFKFIAYAVWWIRREMVVAIEEKK